MIYMGEEEERLSKVFDAISKILSLLIVFSFIPILIRTFTAITPKYRETISITSLEDLTDYMTENVEYSLMYPLLLTSQDILTDYLSETIDITLWLDGWNYRKLATIQGSTTGDVTDYNIRITVHYGAGTDGGEHVYLNGKCNVDFSDIRFTDSDGVTLLPYWIEEKVDGDYAIFWVKIPYIPISPDTAIFYIYYGKSDATSISDGNATFLIFDDFLVKDTVKWTWIDTADVTNGYAYMLRDDFILSNNRPASNVRVRAKMLKTGVSLSVRRANLKLHDGTGTPVANGPSYDLQLVFGYDAYKTNGSYIIRSDNSEIDGNANLAYNSAYPSTGVWYKYENRRYGNTCQAVMHNGTVISATDNTYAGPFGCGFAHFDADTVQLQVDWAFLSKFIIPEPTITAWGSEESL